VHVKYDLDFDSGVIYPGLSIVDLARCAEDSGFDAVWKGESNSADPIVSLAAIATGTRTVKLGTGVYHIFGRSPVTLGIQAATLNDLSDGRLVLGLGISNRTIAAWHGATFDRPVRRIREYAEVVRRVASGQRADGDQELYQAPGFKLSWTPQHPSITCYFAALGEQMTRVTGAHADGVMVNMANPSTLRDIVLRVRKGAEGAGRDPDTLEYAAKVRVCIHPDRDVAVARLKSVLAFYNIAEFYRDMIASMGFAEESASIRAEYQQAGFRAAQAAVPDTLVEGLPTIAAATVEETMDRLQPYLETGITRLIIPFLPATDDAVGETRRLIESWGRITA
jgi:alkanesulfonate monooxygenase SsuD/methylene tetrahydromethanopterin reductase-like flavin-dependent oxidoreductase (luciferase family)